MKTEILESKTAHTPKPKWLRVKLPTGKKYTELRGLVDKYNLHTIARRVVVPIWVSAGVRELRHL